ncbi:MAG: phosphoribosylformimino-5-aminoimidazole carboxamide ribotide isomerase [Spirochaetes bacterium]|nr:phosphoribosylformimino-5-aminoimidazole carboxamide ribotide isomerase [Spirochaetota bacterium]
MKFRPCIDLHNGVVKQIVGSTLSDAAVKENFVSEKPSSHYAKMFRADGLYGGHVIMLGPGNEAQALEALAAYPNGFQIGGGINDVNARGYLDKGASHVIVTSFVFNNGEVDLDNLAKLTNAVGRKRIVLDLSARRRGTDYFIMTNRWNSYTNRKIDRETLRFFAEHCDEFLVHAVDVEGKNSGIEIELLKMLGDLSPITATYAGGIRSMADIELVKEFGKNRIDFTIGSSLDIYGGTMSYAEIARAYR